MSQSLPWLSVRLLRLLPSRTSTRVLSACHAVGNADSSTSQQGEGMELQGSQQELDRCTIISDGAMTSWHIQLPSPPAHAACQGRSAHPDGQQQRQQLWHAPHGCWSLRAHHHTAQPCTTAWHHTQPGHAVMGLSNSTHQRPPCAHFTQQFRGYKSIKRSMKPIYAKASKLAVQPYLPDHHHEHPDAKQRKWQEALQAAPIIDTVLPTIPEVPKPTEFRRLGRITGEYSLGLQPMFAVIQLAGTQFKVTADDIVFVNHLKEVAVNEVLALDRVLLLGTVTSTTIGRPYVPQASVLAAVEEHFQDGVVHVFKFKKRNRYRRYHQTRQALTALRILHVVDDVGGEGAKMALTDHVPIDWYKDCSDNKDDDDDDDASEQEQEPHQERAQASSQ